MVRLRMLIFAVVIILLSWLAYRFFTGNSSNQESDITMTISRKSMVIEVVATGELNAKKSVKIRAPKGMRPAGIYETTLSDLIPEGTIVKEGEYVASLDRTELAGKMSTVQTELEKIQTQLEQAKIDTAIELRGIRDNLINLNFTKKEKLLKVEQSKYEPQSVIQQAQLDLERTERDYQQLLKNYELKQQQSVAKIQEINAQQKLNQRQLDKYNTLSDEFRITAPKGGMVIYARNWNGKKEPGSRISAWDPVVAELPDLTDMISKTYVNEVDISKVQKGQDVNIKVDAFPDLDYTGNVIKVANIGEQLRGKDAKVFEVIVQLNEVDSILRPAMTTSNSIITEILDSVLAIPIEALQTDSLSYVFKNQNGKPVKQEVITGLSNDDEIVVEYGIQESDEIFLNVPEGADDFAFVPLDPAIKEKIRKAQEEAAKERLARATRQKEKVKDVDLPTDGGNGGGDFIIIMD